jgi:hypothetical protein
MDVSPEGLSERKFSELNDGITKRNYVIAEVPIKYPSFYFR